MCTDLFEGEATILVACEKAETLVGRMLPPDSRLYHFLNPLQRGLLNQLPQQGYVACVHILGRNQTLLDPADRLRAAEDGETCSQNSTPFSHHKHLPLSDVQGLLPKLDFSVSTGICRTTDLWPDSCHSERSEESLKYSSK